MLVSIIVPLYNVELYIEECARSLFEQSYGECEYIFVDDCSSDSSVERLEGLVGGDYPHLRERVQIIHHAENRGCSAARNSGIEQAKGEYILFIDGDDWCDTEMVEQLILKGGEADIISCGYYESYGGRLVRYSAPWIGGRNESLRVVITQSFAIPDTICMMLIRRTIFTERGAHFNARLKVGEDFAMKVQLLYYAREIDYVERPLYYYRRNVEGSATYHLGGAARRSYIRAMFFVRDFITMKSDCHQFRLSLAMMPLHVRRWLVMRRGEGLTPRGFALRLLCYGVNALYCLTLRLRYFMRR